MKYYFRLSLLLSILLLSFSATAQHDAFAVRAGANLSHFTGNDVSDSEITVGYHAGLFYHFSLKRKLGIQPELLWSTQGEKREYSSGVIKIRKTQRLSYVQVPVLLVYTSGDFDGLQLMAGPAVSYLAWAQLETETSSPGLKETIAVENEKKFPEADISAQAGIGWLFGGLSVQVRANYGLLSISEAGHDIKNLTYMLTVGLEF